MVGIQSDERGFTITKPLAWTIVVGILSGGIWYGLEQGQTRAQMIDLSEAVQTLKTDLATMETARENLRSEMRREVTALDGRLRSVERSEAQLTEIVRAQTQLLQRIDSRIEAIDNRLRMQEQIPPFRGGVE